MPLSSVSISDVVEQCCPTVDPRPFAEHSAKSFREYVATAKTQIEALYTSAASTRIEILQAAAREHLASTCFSTVSGSDNASHRTLREACLDDLAERCTFIQAKRKKFVEHLSQVSTVLGDALNDKCHCKEETYSSVKEALGVEWSPTPLKRRSTNIAFPGSMVKSNKEESPSIKALGAFHIDSPENAAEALGDELITAYLARYFIEFSRQEESACNIVLPLCPSQDVFDEFYHQVIVKKQLHGEETAVNRMHGEERISDNISGRVEEAMSILWDLLQSSLSQPKRGSEGDEKTKEEISLHVNEVEEMLEIVSDDHYDDIQNEDQEVEVVQSSQHYSHWEKGERSCPLACVVFPLFSSLFQFCCDGTFLEEAAAGLPDPSAKGATFSSFFGASERMKKLREKHGVSLGFATCPYTSLGSHFVVPENLVMRCTLPSNDVWGSREGESTSPISPSSTEKPWNKMSASGNEWSGTNADLKRLRESKMMKAVMNVMEQWWDMQSPPASASDLKSDQTSKLVWPQEHYSFLKTQGGSTEQLEEHEYQIEMFILMVRIRLGIEIVTRILAYQDATIAFAEGELSLMVDEPLQRSLYVEVDALAATSGFLQLSHSSNGIYNSFSKDVMHDSHYLFLQSDFSTSLSDASQLKSLSPDSLLPLIVFPLPEEMQVFYCFAYCLSASIRLDYLFYFDSSTVNSFFEVLLQDVASQAPLLLQCSRLWFYLWEYVLEWSGTSISPEEKSFHVDTLSRIQVSSDEANSWKALFINAVCVRAIEAALLIHPKPPLIFHKESFCSYLSPLRRKECELFQICEQGLIGSLSHQLKCLCQPTQLTE